MSGNNLSVDGEFRYIIQWFNEWSELQREDFLPILVDYLTKDSDDPAIYMNGVVSSMANSTCADKPMSLFQCRIKLFKEWCKRWPEEFKNKLKDKIMEIDPKYGEKLKDELENMNMNGNVSPIPSPPPPPPSSSNENLPPNNIDNNEIQNNEEIAQNA